jgi:hypothetical protein
MREGLRKAFHFLRSKESPSFPEETPLPEPDCLVVLGGGIDQVTLGAGTDTEEKVWKPSRYVVETDQNVEQNDKRTGVRKAIKPREDLRAEHVVHGGTAHLLAGIQFIEEMKRRNTLPKKLVFAAGRPDYIKNVTVDDPEADEGLVMEREFKNRTTGQDFDGMNIEVRGKGSKNTTGDLLNGLKAAWDAKLQSAVVIVTELRKERTEAMCKYLQERYPELGGIKVQFITAEDLLRRRFSPPNSDSRKVFEQVQKELKNSELWHASEGREKTGKGQIEDGSYKFRISPEIDTSGLTDTKPDPQ